MRITPIIALIFMVFLAAGCVSTYSSVTEMPQSQQPLAEVTYNYMECSGNAANALARAMPEWMESEEGMQNIADVGCTSCNDQLRAYYDFVYDKTKDKNLSIEQTLNLRRDTEEKIVDMLAEDNPAQ